MARKRKKRLIKKEYKEAILVVFLVFSMIFLTSFGYESNLEYVLTLATGITGACEPHDDDNGDEPCPEVCELKTIESFVTDILGGFKPISTGVGGSQQYFPATRHLLISEITFTPSQYIEIYNPTDKEVSLALTYYITDGSIEDISPDFDGDEDPCVTMPSLCDEWFTENETGGNEYRPEPDPDGDPIFICQDMDVDTLENLLASRGFTETQINNYMKDLKKRFKGTPFEPKPSLYPMCRSDLIYYLLGLEAEPETYSSITGAHILQTETKTKTSKPSLLTSITGKAIGDSCTEHADCGGDYCDAFMLACMECLRSPHCEENEICLHNTCQKDIDLTAEISINETRIKIDQLIKITFTIKNLGKAPAGTTSYMELKTEDSQPFIKYNLERFDSLGSYSFEYNYTYTDTGSKTISVVVDSQDKITEINENNNAITKDIIIHSTCTLDTDCPGAKLCKSGLCMEEIAGCIDSDQTIAHFDGKNYKQKGLTENATDFFEDICIEIPEDGSNIDLVVDEIFYKSDGIYVKYCNLAEDPDWEGTKQTLALEEFDVGAGDFAIDVYTTKKSKPEDISPLYGHPVPDPGTCITDLIKSTFDIDFSIGAPVTAELDFTNVIPEIFENNNVLTKNVYYGAVDMVVANIFYQPTTLGGIMVEYCNIGAGTYPSSEEFTIQISIPEIPDLIEYSVPTGYAVPNPGECIIVSTIDPPEFTDGNLVIITLDPDNVIPESDNTNNLLTQQVYTDESPKIIGPPLITYGESALEEYYCDVETGAILFETMNCEGQCFAGACVECIDNMDCAKQGDICKDNKCVPSCFDSDIIDAFPDGINIYLEGITENTTDTKWDYCLDETTIVEFFCGEESEESEEEGLLALGGIITSAEVEPIQSRIITCPLCDDGRCYQCTGEEDCEDEQFKKICNPETNYCVECLTSDHCEEASQAFGKELACNLKTGRCVECYQDADCSGSQHCHPDSGRCVSCLDDRHCPIDMTCDTTSGYCVGCTINPDGSDTCPGNLFCSSGQMCVECEADQDCAQGETCTLGSCVTYKEPGKGYYLIAREASVLRIDLGDFLVRFPRDAVIEPDETVIISISGSDDFIRAYGKKPDYELFEDGLELDDVPDMIPVTLENPYSEEFIQEYLSDLSPAELKADLTPAQMKFTEELEGDITAKITIRNIGYIPSDTTCDIYYSITNENTDDIKTGTLDEVIAPGHEIILSISGLQTQEGTNTFVFELDTSDCLDELDEDNNAISQVVYIEPVLVITGSVIAGLEPITSLVTADTEGITPSIRILQVIKGSDKCTTKPFFLLEGDEVAASVMGGLSIYPWGAPTCLRKAVAIPGSSLEIEPGWLLPDTSQINLLGSTTLWHQVIYDYYLGCRSPAVGGPHGCTVELTEPGIYLVDGCGVCDKDSAFTVKIPARCSFNEDCNDLTDATKCNLEHNLCVECTSDDDCSVEDKCIAGRCSKDIDLSIGRIELIPQTRIMQNDEVVFKVTVVNTGTVAATNFNVKIGTYYSEKILELAPSATYTVETIGLEFKGAGETTLNIEVDEENNVKEVDEENNAYTLTLFVYAPCTENEDCPDDFACKTHIILYPASQVGACMPKIEACTDTDISFEHLDGEDPLIKGFTENDTYYGEDDCSYMSDGIQNYVEYYCEDNAFSKRHTLCPVAQPRCSDGACVECVEDDDCGDLVCKDKKCVQKCSDTDVSDDHPDGKDYFVSGIAENLSMYIIDTCKNETAVIEYYCDGDDIKKEEYSCIGCEYGHCVECLANEDCPEGKVCRNKQCKESIVTSTSRPIIPPTLNPDSETLVLFYWDMESPLVKDVDYVQWGTRNKSVDKSGIKIEDKMYPRDTPVEQQAIIAPLELEQKPDLTPISIEFIPSDPLPDSYVTAKITVRNLGDVTADPLKYSIASIREIFYSIFVEEIGNSEQTGTLVQILAPGEDGMVIVTDMPVVEGANTFTFTIDQNNYFEESNEQNNALTQTIVVSEASSAATGAVIADITGRVTKSYEQQVIQAAKIPGCTPYLSQPGKIYHNVKTSNYKFYKDEVISVGVTEFSSEPYGSHYDAPSCLNGPVGSASFSMIQIAGTTIQIPQTGTYYLDSCGKCDTVVAAFSATIPKTCSTDSGCSEDSKCYTPLQRCGDCSTNVDCEEDEMCIEGFCELAQCSDTDRTELYDTGINPYLKGTVFYEDTVYEDTCSSGKQLIEYYCIGDEKSSQIVYCDKNCIEGECTGVPKEGTCKDYPLELVDHHMDWLDVTSQATNLMTDKEFTDSSYVTVIGLQTFFEDEDSPLESEIADFLLSEKLETYANYYNVNPLLLLAITLLKIKAADPISEDDVTDFKDSILDLGGLTLEDTIITNLGNIASQLKDAYNLCEADEPITIFSITGATVLDSVFSAFTTSKAKLNAGLSAITAMVTAQIPTRISITIPYKPVNCECDPFGIDCYMETEAFKAYKDEWVCSTPIGAADIYIAPSRAVYIHVNYSTSRANSLSTNFPLYKQTQTGAECYTDAPHGIPIEETTQGCCIKIADRLAIKSTGTESTTSLDEGEAGIFFFRSHVCKYGTGSAVVKWNCESDADCVDEPVNKKCDPGSAVCTECMTDDDCPENEFCREHSCKYKKPDLHPRYTGFNISDVAGTNVHFEFVLVNSGGAKVKQKYNITIEIYKTAEEEPEIISHRIDGPLLLTDASETITVYQTLEPVEYNFTIIVDPENNVDEISEYNNRRFTIFTPKHPCTEDTDCPVGEICENEICVIPPDCSETDDGKDYYTQGTTENSYFTKTDTCRTETKLEEYYCDVDDIRSENFTCPNECVGGSCEAIGDPIEITPVTAATCALYNYIPYLIQADFLPVEYGNAYLLHQIYNKLKEDLASYRPCEGAVSYSRICGAGELGERPFAGAGITGHDETSENVAMSFVKTSSSLESPCLYFIPENLDEQVDEVLSDTGLPATNLDDNFLNMVRELLVAAAVNNLGEIPEITSVIEDDQLVLSTAGEELARLDIPTSALQITTATILDITAYVALFDGLNMPGLIADADALGFDVGADVATADNYAKLIDQNLQVFDDNKKKVEDDYDQWWDDYSDAITELESAAWGVVAPEITDYEDDIVDAYAKAAGLGIFALKQEAENIKDEIATEIAQLTKKEAETLAECSVLEPPGIWEYADPNDPKPDKGNCWESPTALKKYEVQCKNSKGTFGVGIYGMYCECPAGKIANKLGICEIPLAPLAAEPEPDGVIPPPEPTAEPWAGTKFMSDETTEGGKCVSTGGDWKEGLSGYYCDCPVGSVWRGGCYGITAENEAKSRCTSSGGTWIMDTAKCLDCPSNKKLCYRVCILKDQICTTFQALDPTEEPIEEPTVSTGLVTAVTGKQIVIGEELMTSEKKALQDKIREIFSKIKILNTQVNELTKEIATDVPPIPPIEEICPTVLNLLTSGQEEDAQNNLQDKEDARNTAADALQNMIDNTCGGGGLQNCRDKMVDTTNQIIDAMNLRAEQIKAADPSIKVVPSDYPDPTYQSLQAQWLDYSEGEALFNNQIQIFATANTEYLDALVNYQQIGGVQSFVQEIADTELSRADDIYRAELKHIQEQLQAAYEPLGQIVYALTSLQAALSTKYIIIRETNSYKINKKIKISFENDIVKTPEYFSVLLNAQSVRYQPYQPHDADHECPGRCKELDLEAKDETCEIEGECTKSFCVRVEGISPTPPVLDDEEEDGEAAAPSTDSCDPDSDPNCNQEMNRVVGTGIELTPAKLAAGEICSKKGKIPYPGTGECRECIYPDAAGCLKTRYQQSHIDFVFCHESGLCDCLEETLETTCFGKIPPLKYDIETCACTDIPLVTECSKPGEEKQCSDDKKSVEMCNSEYKWETYIICPEDTQCDPDSFECVKEETCDYKCKQPPYNYLSGKCLKSPSCFGEGNSIGSGEDYGCLQSYCCCTSEEEVTCKETESSCANQYKLFNVNTRCCIAPRICTDLEKIYDLRGESDKNIGCCSHNEDCVGEQFDLGFDLEDCSCCVGRCRFDCLHEMYSDDINDFLRSIEREFPKTTTSDDPYLLYEIILLGTVDIVRLQEEEYSFDNLINKLAGLFPQGSKNERTAAAIALASLASQQEGEIRDKIQNVLDKDYIPQELYNKIDAISKGGDPCKLIKEFEDIIKKLEGKGPEESCDYSCKQEGHISGSCSKPCQGDEVDIGKGESYYCQEIQSCCCTKPPEEEVPEVTITTTSPDEICKTPCSDLDGICINLEEPSIIPKIIVNGVSCCPADAECAVSCSAVSDGEICTEEKPVCKGSTLEIFGEQCCIGKCTEKALTIGSIYTAIVNLVFGAVRKEPALCPYDTGPCADIAPGKPCYTEDGKDGICDEDCKCIPECKIPCEDGICIFISADKKHIEEKSKQENCCPPEEGMRCVTGCSDVGTICSGEMPECRGTSIEIFGEQCCIGECGCTEEKIKQLMQGVRSIQNQRDSKLNEHTQLSNQLNQIKQEFLTKCGNFWNFLTKSQSFWGGVSTDWIEIDNYYSLINHLEKLGLPTNIFKKIATTTPVHFISGDIFKYQDNWITKNIIEIPRDFSYISYTRYLDTTKLNAESILDLYNVAWWAYHDQYVEHGKTSMDSEEDESVFWTYLKFHLEPAVEFALAKDANTLNPSQLKDLQNKLKASQLAIPQKHKEVISGLLELYSPAFSELSGSSFQISKECQSLNSQINKLVDQINSIAGEIQELARQLRDASLKVAYCLGESVGDSTSMDTALAAATTSIPGTTDHSFAANEFRRLITESDDPDIQARAYLGEALLALKRGLICRALDKINSALELNPSKKTIKMAEDLKKQTQLSTLKTINSMLTKEDSRAWKMWESQRTFADYTGIESATPWDTFAAIYDGTGNLVRVALAELAGEEIKTYLSVENQITDQQLGVAALIYAVEEGYDLGEINSKTLEDPSFIENTLFPDVKMDPDLQTKFILNVIGALSNHDVYRLAHDCEEGKDFKFKTGEGYINKDILKYGVTDFIWDALDLKNAALFFGLHAPLYSGTTTTIASLIGTALGSIPGVQTLVQLLQKTQVYTKWSWAGRTLLSEMGESLAGTAIGFYNPATGMWTEIIIGMAGVFDISPIRFGRAAADAIIDSIIDAAKGYDDAALAALRNSLSKIEFGKFSSADEMIKAIKAQAGFDIIDIDSILKKASVNLQGSLELSDEEFTIMMRQASGAPEIPEIEIPTQPEPFGVSAVGGPGAAALPGPSRMEFNGGEYLVYYDKTGKLHVTTLDGNVVNPKIENEIYTKIQEGDIYKYEGLSPTEIDDFLNRNIIPDSVSLMGVLTPEAIYTQWKFLSVSASIDTPVDFGAFKAAGGTLELEWIERGATATFKYKVTLKHGDEIIGTYFFKTPPMLRNEYASQAVVELLEEGLELEDMLVPHTRSVVNVPRIDKNGLPVIDAKTGEQKTLKGIIMDWVDEVSSDEAGIIRNSANYKASENTGNLFDTICGQTDRRTPGNSMIGPDGLRYLDNENSFRYAYGRTVDDQVIKKLITDITKTDDGNIYLSRKVIDNLEKLDNNLLHHTLEEFGILDADIEAAIVRKEFMQDFFDRLIEGWTSIEFPDKTVHVWTKLNIVWVD